MEHLAYREREIVLRDFHRCLKRRVIAQMAMPDLDYIIQKYKIQDWRNQDWLSWPEYEFVKTRGK